MPRSTYSRAGALLADCQHTAAEEVLRKCANAIRAGKAGAPGSEVTRDCAAQIRELVADWLEVGAPLEMAMLVLADTLAFGLSLCPTHDAPEIRNAAKIAFGETLGIYAMPAGHG